MRFGGTGSRWRCGRGRVRSHWPTKLPGIGFQVRGAIAFQLPPGQRGERVAAEAAARLALEREGRMIAAAHRPDELEIVRQKVVQRTRQWCEWEVGPVEGRWRAQIVLTLSKEDEAKSQSHLNSLRAARLRVEQDQVRQDWFRNEVLAAPDTARIWWLLTHTGSAPKPRWEEFREHILPLVSAGDDVQSRADRFVQGVARLWDELGDDPGRHARFVEVVDQVLTRMGWPNDESWWIRPAPAPEPGAGTEPDSGAVPRGRGGRRGGKG